LAVVAPVFFLVILGIVEFGRGMMASSILTQASREGARMGIVQGNTNTDVENYVRALVANTLQCATADVGVTVTVDEAPGNPSAGNQVQNAQKEDLVTVEVQVPFDKISYISGQFLAGKQLIADSSMRHE
jgi:Flp pilus assembly protein TadG